MAAWMCRKASSEVVAGVNAHLLPDAAAQDDGLGDVATTVAGAAKSDAASAPTTTVLCLKVPTDPALPDEDGHDWPPIRSRQRCRQASGVAGPGSPLPLADQTLYRGMADEKALK